MAGFSGLSFTKLDYLTRLDYVWPVSQANQPGVSGCRVYNPELLRDDLDNLNSPFIFDDITVNKNPVRMKAFAAWNSVSDHYPVFMKFYVP